jgi:hypothetical protein
MDLGSEACRDLLHYAPGRVVGFHSRTAGGFRPGEKWTVRETNCETVTLESNGKVRQFKPSAKGKWDVLVSSAMQVSVGDQIRVTAGFRGDAPSANSSGDGNGTSPDTIIGNRASTLFAWAIPNMMD